jgi:hypothetical protein
MCLMRKCLMRSCLKLRLSDFAAFCNIHVDYQFFCPIRRTLFPQISRFHTALISISRKVVIRHIDSKRMKGHKYPECSKLTNTLGKGDIDEVIYIHSKKRDTFTNGSEDGSR